MCLYSEIQEECRHMECQIALSIYINSSVCQQNGGRLPKTFHSRRQSAGGLSSNGLETGLKELPQERFNISESNGSNGHPSSESKQFQEQSVGYAFNFPRQNPSQPIPASLLKSLSDELALIKRNQSQIIEKLTLLTNLLSPDPGLKDQPHD